MNRLQVFESYEKDAFFYKKFSKLKPLDLILCNTYLEQWSKLDKNEFALKLNDLQLSKHQDKSNQWMLIWELLSCANSGSDQ
jgi:hypothetical protein